PLLSFRKSTEAYQGLNKEVCLMSSKAYSSSGSFDCLETPHCVRSILTFKSLYRQNPCKTCQPISIKVCPKGSLPIDRGGIRALQIVGKTLIVQPSISG